MYMYNFRVKFEQIKISTHSVCQCIQIHPRKYVQCALCTERERDRERELKYGVLQNYSGPLNPSTKYIGLLPKFIRIYFKL